ncbi:MAG: hypothetical protein OXC93_12650 [Rhodospirillaceae bacterium]|nr:hypothetical protein [Rhodospirillaceae bacterium]
MKVRLDFMPFGGRDLYARVKGSVSDARPGEVCRRIEGRSGDRRCRAPAAS